LTTIQHSRTGGRAAILCASYSTVIDAGGLLSSATLMRLSPAGIEADWRESRSNCQWRCGRSRGAVDGMERRFNADPLSDTGVTLVRE
jgi:hypothetical protein